MPAPFWGRTERSITTKGTVTALGGVFSRGMPVLGAGLPATMGTVYHVSSTHANASDSNDGKNPKRPMATIDAAWNKCTANVGDVVLVHEAHAETITTAAGIAADTAGVSIIGVGQGNDRPKITVSTINGASIAVSAASVTIANIIVIGNKDGLTQPIDITGNDCTIDIEYRDTSASVEAVAVILATTVSRLNVRLKYVGFTTGDAAARPVNLVGVTGARIEIDGYGVVTTAWVNFTTTLSTDVFVTGRTYTQGVTNGSRNVVDTIGSSKWFMDVYDASAGARYSGGSAAAVASDDISAANSSIVSLGVADSTGLSSGLSATVSYGVAGSTANSSGLSATVSAGVLISTGNSSTVSLGVADSTGLSSGLSATVSAGVLVSTGNSSTVSLGVADSTGLSSGLSATVSYGVAGSTANSSGLSATVSTGVLVSTGNSSTVSLGVADSTGLSSGLSATVSYGVAGSTANSSGLSATVSYGVAGSTANSSGLSATVSHGVAGSTAHSTSLVAINSIGKPVGKASSAADIAGIPNNVQGAGGLLATATGGDVFIEEVVFSKDGTALTGPTSIELSCNNVYGPNGADDILGSNVAAGLGSQDTVRMTAATVAMKPFVLESTKALYVHGSDAAGTSGGNYRYSVIGRALTAGATLV